MIPTIWMIKEGIYHIGDICRLYWEGIDFLLHLIYNYAVFEVVQNEDDEIDWKVECRCSMKEIYECLSINHDIIFRRDRKKAAITSNSRLWKFIS